MKDGEWGDFMLRGYQQEYDIEFKTGFTGNTHFHEAVECFYVMSGKVSVRVMEQEYLLDQDDFLVINSNHKHSWTGMTESAVCEIHFDYQMILEQMHRQLIYFRCNSTLFENEMYEHVRGRIGQLLGECYLYTSEYTFNKKSHMYALLDELIRYFLVDEIKIEAENGDLRTEQMLQYISAHYLQNLSAQEVAGQLYMSASAFSRFFKKTMSMNFPEYLNELRMHHAIWQLCYTGDSITDIAQNHGFSSASSFCRLFKELYGVSPMVYRKSFDEQIRAKPKVNKKIENYLRKYAANLRSNQENAPGNESVYVVCHSQNYRIRHCPWNKVMNLGFAEEMLRTGMFEKIRTAREELGFELGRVVGMFSRYMLQYQEHSWHIQNFSRIDAVMDFLVEAGLAPILTLDNKQRELITDIEKLPKRIAQEFLFESIEEFVSVLDDFIDHAVRRYGLKQVSSWNFECWYHSNEHTVMGVHTDFIAAFEMISSAIKKKLPYARVGGRGISSTDDGENYQFTGIIKRWKDARIHPDFISLMLYPYRAMTAASGEGRHKAVNREVNTSDFYDRAIEVCRKKMDECGLYDVALCVCEWNLSMSMRNYFNESCGKGAMMARVMSNGNIRLVTAGYSELFDMNKSNERVSEKNLYGGSALISMFDARKPAYYAMLFYNKLLDYLLYKDKYCVVTTDAFGSYAILCNNAKRLKYSYYTQAENKIDPGEVPGIFENEKNLEITFDFKAVVEGTYCIREFKIDKNHGSLLDEWCRLEGQKGLRREDTEYLKEISRPVMTRRFVDTSGDRLVFKHKMTANQISLLLITK